MRAWKSVSLALGVLTLDQATKGAAGALLSPGESVSVLGDILRLTMVYNTGGAFGLLPGHTTMLLGLSATMVLAAGWALFSGKPWWAPRPGVALLWAGTAGNLIDRIRWGYVLDFVQVPYWPVFNVADSAILIGAALITWGLLRRAN
ncbi:MAG: signal peptidase II [Candidatus Bipolaricaulota bacterium]